MTAIELPTDDAWARDICPTFVRDNEGNDYFLEINMRNDGNAYCVTSAGVNLPYIWCYYQLHKTSEPSEEGPR